MKDVITTKGQFYKKIRFHGRGGMGIGSRKQTKVRMTVKVLNIPQLIEKARNRRQKIKWQKRLELIQKIKSEKSSSTQLKEVSNTDSASQ